MARLSRRSLLAGGAAAIAGVAAAGYGEIDGDLPGTHRVRTYLGLTGRDGTVPAVPPAITTYRVFASAARHTNVNVITMVPRGISAADLPVCVVLHGRSNNAEGSVRRGMPQFLTQAVTTGQVPPFALVAVDGNPTSYWVPRTPDDDPQAMLRHELPAWLASMGMPAPGATLGLSMGGFGALVSAETGGPSRVAVVSPAIFRSWGDAKVVDSFSGEPEWEQWEPLCHLRQLPAGYKLGIWCGYDDPFYKSARQLAANTKPAVAAFSAGLHDDGFWMRVFPDVFSFLGHSLAGPPTIIA